MGTKQERKHIAGVCREGQGEWKEAEGLGKSKKG